MKPAFCAFLLTAVASVNAHGFLNATIIDGESHIGNYPYGNGSNTDSDPPSAIRRVSDVTPVRGATNSSLGCGLDATAAKLVAHADPGSKISFNCRGPDYVAVRLAAVLVIRDYANSYCLASGRTTLAPC